MSLAEVRKTGVWEVKRITTRVDDDADVAEIVERWEIWHRLRRKRLGMFYDEGLAWRIVRRLETEKFPIPWEDVGDEEDAQVNRAQVCHIVQEEKRRAE